jgi:hypothetical protein
MIEASARPDAEDPHPGPLPEESAEKVVGSTEK